MQRTRAALAPGLLLASVRDRASSESGILRGQESLEVRKTMRTISRMAAPLALLFTFAAAASAQPNANDSVDYAPKTQNLAGTFPFDRSYTLDITSPSQLNRAGTDAIAAGITATLRVNVVDFPEGSSDAAAATLVTLDDQSLFFNALAQTRRTKIGRASGR